MANVREYLVKMITEVCRPDPVDLSDHSRPLLDSGLDSLDFASVLMDIEDHFKIQVSEEALDQVGSIDRMVAYIEAQAHA